MKKSSLFFVFAMVVTIVALTFPTSAKADNFSATGNGITVNENITLGAPTAPGVFNITNVSGTFSDAALGITNGTITGLYANQGALNNTCWAGNCGLSYASTDGLWNYDNLYQPGANPFDAWAGELFTVVFDGMTYEVNVADVGGQLQIWASENGGYVINGTDGEPLTATPEPSSLLLLGTGLLGFAFFVSRKAKDRSPQLITM